MLFPVKFDDRTEEHCHRTQKLSFPDAKLVALEDLTHWISRRRIFSCGQISCRIVQKCIHKVSSCSRHNCYFQARLSILSASPKIIFCDHNLNLAAYAAAIGG